MLMAENPSCHPRLLGRLSAGKAGGVFPRQSSRGRQEFYEDFESKEMKARVRIRPHPGAIPRSAFASLDRCNLGVLRPTLG